MRNGLSRSLEDSRKAALARAENQYEVWYNAMELLKSIFRQTAEIVNFSAQMGEVWFKDFGTLELQNI